MSTLSRYLPYPVHDERVSSLRRCSGYSIMFLHTMSTERRSAAMAGVRWCGMSAGALKTLAVLSACILWSPASGAAEYRLDVGDVLEISVAGVPDLRQRVSVELDGNISFPSLGTLEVGGLAPSEVRAKI